MTGTLLRMIRGRGRIEESGPRYCPCLRGNSPPNISLAPFFSLLACSRIHSPVITAALPHLSTLWDPITTCHHRSLTRAPLFRYLYVTFILHVFVIDTSLYFRYDGHFCTISAYVAVLFFCLVFSMSLTSLIKKANGCTTGSSSIGKQGKWKGSCKKGFRKYK